jgi:WD40 repeat protein
VLAYVDRRDHVRVADVDSGRQLWRSAQVGGPAELAWSPDGRRLLVATGSGWRVFGADGLLLARRSEFGVADVAWAPGGRRIAVVLSSTSGSTILMMDPAGRGRPQELSSGPGRYGQVAFSPDGRRLLVPWPDADQWLFLMWPRGQVAAVGNIGRQFARGGRSGPFPDAVEWCCGD